MIRLSRANGQLLFQTLVVTNPLCPIHPSQHKSFTLSYFRLYTHEYPMDYCSGPVVTTGTSMTQHVPAEPQGSARFFVCIGVLAMLYCMAILVWYVFLEVKFLNMEIVPLVVSINMPITFSSLMAQPEVVFCVRVCVCVGRGVSNLKPIFFSLQPQNFSFKFTILYKLHQNVPFSGIPNLILLCILITAASPVSHTCFCPTGENKK